MWGINTEFYACTLACIYYPLIHQSAPKSEYMILDQLGKHIL